MKLNLKIQSFLTIKISEKLNKKFQFESKYIFF